ncbi:MAG: hypothetical protein R6V58_10400 [Planctomycetota bacterium]
MKARAVTAVSVLALALTVAGCAGHSTHYDPAADRYETAARAGAAAPTDRVARCTVHVIHRVADELADPVSADRPRYQALAREAIETMGVFRPANIRRHSLRPDYHFIFDVSIEDTAEPGLCSGLIIPFYRTRTIEGRLQVLDEQGAPFAAYVASAGAFQYRHPLVFFLTPFCWPGWAERRARDRVFRALAVKLIEDAREYR